MKPILYHSNENEFKSNGIGILSDCTSCEVTEELNGKFELKMKYPLNGFFFDEIKMRCIVLAKPNKSDKPQPFRIYRITKPMNGVVTIYAEHLSYDLAGIPVNPFSATSATQAVQAIEQNSAIDNPFYFFTDKTTTARMNITAPRSARNAVFGQENSLLDVYTGDLYFDCFNVFLLSRRGADKNRKIVYGKNLTDLTQEENIAATYTGIYPYAVDADGNLITLTEKIVRAEGNFGFERIKDIDFSSEFTNEDGTQTEITETTLRKVVEDYMKSHEFGKPVVSIDVSFVDLADTEEYKNIAFLESVDLGDTVTVEFEKLGISTKARCSKTMFNSLAERYESVVIGEIQKTIADSVSDVPTKDFVRKEDASNRVALNEAIKKATELLNGSNGGVFEILDENGDGINDAAIWRSNDSQQFIKVTKDGFGLTTDGGQTYIYALTPFGFDANAITAGKVAAERIDTDELFAREITVTGQFKATTQAFLEPEQPELETIKNHLLKIETIPTARLPLYDFNGDGTVSAQDLLTAQKVILGLESLADWKGAQKTTVNVTIDLKNPKKAIHLTGVNMWGRQIEKWFGFDSIFADDNIEATFAELLTLSQPHQDVVADIEDVNDFANEIDERTTPSEWIPFMRDADDVIPVAEEIEGPSYRKVGNHVYISGGFKPTFLPTQTTGYNLALLPEGYRPQRILHFITPASGSRIARFYITSSGTLALEWVYDFIKDEIVSGSDADGVIPWISLRVDYYVK